MTRSTTHLKRRQLDRKLIHLQPLEKTRSPKEGWLKAIRESLGMTASQAAARVNVSQQSWTKAEISEAQGTTSLATLRRMAEALGCSLVYAVVPRDGSLDEILKRRAKNVATAIMKRTQATMKLEDQAISKAELDQQIEEMTLQIADDLKSSLWED